MRRLRRAAFIFPCAQTQLGMTVSFCNLIIIIYIVLVACWSNADVSTIRPNTSLGQSFAIPMAIFTFVLIILKFETYRCSFHIRRYLNRCRHFVRQMFLPFIIHLSVNYIPIQLIWISKFMYPVRIVSIVCAFVCLFAERITVSISYLTLDGFLFISIYKKGSSRLW